MTTTDNEQLRAAEDRQYLHNEVSLATRIWYRDGNAGRLRYVVEVLERFEEKQKDA